MSDNLIPEGVKTFFTSKRVSYQRTFPENDRDAEKVLSDLAKFCRADKSTFHKDPRAHAVLEGRREVFLRIKNYLNLNEQELWDLYRKD